MKRDREVNHYTYSNTWEIIENLLDEAEKEQNKRWMSFRQCPPPLRQHHWNNYKGLEGVINTLKWVLGDLNMTKDIVLGRDKQ